ncbi:TetR/AcrR family transcriptional regulator [Aminobacter sp. HY435]|uniref:TetR/AcrR family transcriptional regulator n=1 Tax=Aminobacter sp. HY435 TaxID=2970917 RepID=UPI0022B99D87|nr:TetR/AcrR family transcriptional regulator [Aminobacter sp. HY435]
MEATEERSGQQDDRDTRGALLRAATFVFADRGFDAATLREVTRAAGANIAAVNYHFRSKDELLRLTLEQCLGPLNAARLEAIKACEDDARPDLRSVLRAIVRPLVELSLDERGGRAAIRLMLQTKALPRSLTNEIFAEQFDELHRRSRQMLQRVAPHLSEAQIALRYEYIRGAILHIVADLDPNARRMPGLEDIQEHVSNSALIEDIISFFETGISGRD